MLLFAGQFVPLPLMPKVIQDISQYLHFQLLLYFPIQLILGKLSAQQIVHGFVAGVIWLVIAVAFFHWMWRRGIKQYSAVGA